MGVAGIAEREGGARRAKRELEGRQKGRGRDSKKARGSEGRKGGTLIAEREGQGGQQIAEGLGSHAAAVPPPLPC